MNESFIEISEEKHTCEHLLLYFGLSNLISRKNFSIEIDLFFLLFETTIFTEKVI